MKALVRILSICVLLSLITGCGAQQAAAPAAPAAGQPASMKVSPEVDAWLKAAQLGSYAPAKQDWAAIEAAAKKEGKVLVYANSSRIADVKKTFEAKYPGITLEGFDLGGDDVLTKVREEQKAGAFTGDVMFASAAAGEVVSDLLPKQQLWAFVPDGVASVLPDAAKNPLPVSRYGIRVLGYNSELNKTCPVGNWWDLTEPAWKGKVFIEDPLADASTMAIYTTIVSHAKDLAAAYKEKYGKDPVLDSDTPDAGWLWLKMFAKNKPVPQPGGDEVTASFASKGMKDNLVGFTSYSKYRNTVKGTVVFEPCKTLKPVVGVQTATYLAIINRAPHPNAAKLFINYVYSQEGFEPWNVIGDYSPLTTKESPKGAIPYTELSKMVWTIDEPAVYKTIGKVRDFYSVTILK